MRHVVCPLVRKGLEGGALRPDPCRLNRPHPTLFTPTVNAGLVIHDGGWYISWYPPTEACMTAKRAKVFWSGRSQAVRLPKEFRFQGEIVLVRRQGKGILLEPIDEWPENYTSSFAGIPDDFRRLKQGKHERREG